LETENPVQAFAEGTSYSEFSEKAMHRKRPEKQSSDKASREQHDRSGKTLANRLHFIRGNKQQLVLSQPHRYLYRFLTDTRRASQPDQLSKNTKSDTKCSSHGSVLRGTDD
jgi:hypothetical protein